MNQYHEEHFGFKKHFNHFFSCLPLSSTSQYTHHFIFGSLHFTIGPPDFAVYGINSIAMFLIVIQVECAGIIK